MPKRFFLTHSTKDKPMVLRVGRVLAAMGFDVWIDKYEIRAGDSLTRKIFGEGLRKTDYVCAFLTRISVRSAWVQEELDFAFHRAMTEGKPKIVMLQFGGAKIPVFLRHRRYASLRTFEISEIVREILASADLPAMNLYSDPLPYTSLDYHDALSDIDALYLLASRRDQSEIEPYRDMEGIVFPSRHIFVIRVDKKTNLTTHHYVVRARIAHTALRVIGGQFALFLNTKLENNSFAMSGFIYRFKIPSLEATSVHAVFEHRNWGWNPVIDEDGHVHHKDSETAGNPYLIDGAVAERKDKSELFALERRWRSTTCPYPSLEGPGRETGYLRFLDLDVSVLPAPAYISLT